MARKDKRSSQGQKRKAKLAKRERKRKKRRKRQAAKPRMDRAGSQGSISLQELLQRRLREMWDPEAIRPMATDAVIGKLSELGIEFEEDVFRSAVRRHYSSSQLAEDLWGAEMRQIDGPDADFPWMAAGVLWERLCPDVANTETIIDGIDQGDDLLERDAEAACDRWLQVWDELKSRFLEGATSVETVEERAGNYYSIEEWIAVLDRELGNAGIRNSEYLQKRIAFCTEVARLLPDPRPDFLRCMDCSVAESYFMLGDAEAGDAAFAELVSKYPDQRWLCYTKWGDLWTGQYGSKVPADLKKAKMLYQKAAELAPPEGAESVNQQIENLQRNENEE